MTGLRSNFAQLEAQDVQLLLVGLMLQRKRRHLSEAAARDFETCAGLTPGGHPGVPHRRSRL